MADLTLLAVEIDALLPGRALVSGAAPHHARDLDLLLPAADAALLVPALVGAGFVPTRGHLVRLGAAAEVVDVEPIEGRALPAAEQARLLADGALLPGCTRLSLPGPADVLLLLAARVAPSGGRLALRRLARAQEALDRDPDAVLVARSRAAAWGCAGGLELLLAQLEGRPVPGPRARRLTAEDAVPLPGRARRLAGRVVGSARRRPGGLLVGVSGLDGAGKTTQTEALVVALEALGEHPVLLWDRFGYELVVQRAGQLGRDVGTALRTSRRRRGGHAAGGPAPATAGPRPRTPAAPLPDAPPARMPAGARAAWLTFVVAAHVARTAPATRRQLRAGRVVVRDRCTLDAVVHLHERYGRLLAVGPWERLLLRALPREDLAYLLDVPAEEALRRKAEQFDLVALRATRERTLEHAHRLGVDVVDGTLPAPVVAARLLADVAAALAVR